MAPGRGHGRKTALDLGQALIDDIATGRSCFEQKQEIARNRLEFQDKIKANKDVWRNQHAYWEAKGWG